MCYDRARTAFRLVDNKGERPLTRETVVGRRWRVLAQRYEQRAREKKEIEKRDRQLVYVT